MNIELLGLLKWGWIALGSWFWYDKQRYDKKLESLSDKQNTSPTYEEMEKAIAKAVDPVREDQKELVITSREIYATLNQLARDLAVLNAKWSMTNERSQNNDRG